MAWLKAVQDWKIRWRLFLHEFPNGVGSRGRAPNDGLGTKLTSERQKMFFIWLQISPEICGYSDSVREKQPPCLPSNLSAGFSFHSHRSWQFQWPGPIEGWVAGARDPPCSPLPRGTTAAFQQQQYYSVLRLWVQITQLVVHCLSSTTLCLKKRAHLETLCNFVKS